MPRRDEDVVAASPIMRHYIAKIFFVMKLFTEAVAIPERIAWKNRHLASGIATRL